MGTPRALLRPLSWFLARLRTREDADFNALKASLRSRRPASPSPALPEKTEDLLWTCR